MGIVNLTGDSFSEGAASAPETGLDRAEQLLKDGADLLDLGAESTRPGCAPVSEEEELRRLLPTLRELRRKYPELVLSVDTRHGSVAKEALRNGADVINDVGMARDPGMAEAVADAGKGAVLLLCHSRATPGTMADARWMDYGKDVVTTVMAELRQAAELAVRAGVGAEQIWYDPGCGFAKTAEQNFELIARAEEFRALGRVLYGISRKSFIGKASGEADPMRRLGGTLAAELELCRQGVDMIRTHDVRELRNAMAVAKAIGGMKQLQKTVQEAEK